MLLRIGTSHYSFPVGFLIILLKHHPKQHPAPQSIVDWIALLFDGAARRPKTVELELGSVAELRSVVVIAYLPR